MMSASTTSPRGDHLLAVRQIDRGEQQRIVVGLRRHADGSRSLAVGRAAGSAHRCDRTRCACDRLADRNRGLRIDGSR